MDAQTLLQEMVSIESLSGQEQPLAEYLVAQMQQLGFSQAYIDEAGNAVGIQGQEQQPGEDIVLLGHMDTVPGEIPLQIVDGKLYGRGSVDAKGPLATFIMAASQIKPSPGKGRLIVIGAVEEEAATSKGARYVKEQFSPRACIIGEPSHWNAVTLGYKGRMLVEYCREQPSSHTAGPERAVAEWACDWWQQIGKYAQHFNEGHSKLFAQLLPSLRHFQTHSDGMSDKVNLTVGFRLPPGFDTESFIEKIRQWAEPAQLRVYGMEQAYQSKRSNFLARAFIRALRHKDQRARFKMKTGTSDMNVVGPHWQCPIVAYGPGNSELDHTPEEHIELAEYHQAIEILTDVLAQLCQEKS